ncbi:hypothetical protein EYZ11_004605 [Aspergillus tanneri]|uniref:Uncharacterized protein n=1 Tax=Aspergillus tanneri TaxID=1220188 RepID=A0A4S3JK21_9EURO|nr:hypothetical protein EYZ11_004605 [Aspergillus tanneri]
MTGRKSWLPPYRLDIEQSLGFHSNSINWVLIVYNITFASYLLIAGTTTLAISNITNTAAPNKAALLTGSAISGIGAGLTSSNGLAILNNAFSDGEERNKALAIYTAVICGLEIYLLGVPNNGWHGNYLSIPVPTTIFKPQGLAYRYYSTWFFISTQVCVNLLGYTTVLTAVFFLGEEHPGRGSIYTTTGPVAWAFATPDRAGGTGHGEGYWCALLATIIFVVGSLVTLVPTQSILRQMEWGNHAVAGALFNTAYQGGASVY